MKNEIEKDCSNNVVEYRTPDFWNAVGVSFAYMIYSSGIKPGLKYLLGMLTPMKDICRINLGCSSLGEEKFIVPLCDTYEKGMEFTRIPTIKNPFSIISENTITRPTIIDDLETLKREALKVDPSVNTLPFFNHSSMMRLPLYKRPFLRQIIRCLTALA